MTRAEIMSELAQSFEETADMLEEISPSRYGLLITSLRWHASQTASGDFSDEFDEWIMRKIKR
jgi:hypothetical protein